MVETSYPVAEGDIPGMLC